MSNWTNVAVPISTLALGSVLTMAGQALKDRRTAERERRNRRAEFLSTNFEVHRTAILEMQGLVSEGYTALMVEKRRRTETGFYDFFGNWPSRSLAEEYHAIHANQEELTRVTEDETLTRDEKIKMAKGLVDNLVEQAKAFHSNTVVSTKDLQMHIEGVYPFWENHINWMGKLRLRMVRSGSNSVVESGEEFILAVFRWSEQFGLGERLDELGHQVVECRRDLDRTLANALKYGPYNELDKKQK